MALTADQMATVCNDLGIDTPEKFRAFIRPAQLVLRRDGLRTQIEKKLIDKQAAADAFSADIAALTSQVEALQAQIRSGV